MTEQVHVVADAPAKKFTFNKKLATRAAIAITGVAAIVVVASKLKNNLPLDVDVTVETPKA